LVELGADQSFRKDSKHSRLPRLHLHLQHAEFVFVRFVNNKSMKQNNKSSQKQIETEPRHFCLPFRMIKLVTHKKINAESIYTNSCKN